VSWLIYALLGLALLTGLAVITRGMGRLPQPDDDTLVTDLLGPPDRSLGRTQQSRAPAGPPSVARVWEEARASSSLRTRGATAPAVQAPPRRHSPAARGPSLPARAPEEAKPAPAPAAPAAPPTPATPPTPAAPATPAAAPAEDADWLQTQLAWITSWSQQIQDQITSADDPDPDSDQ
jgi:hypothetical protein